MGSDSLYGPVKLLEVVMDFFIGRWTFGRFEAANIKQETDNNYIGSVFCSKNICIIGWLWFEIMIFLGILGVWIGIKKTI